MKADPDLAWKGLMRTWRPTKPLIAAVEGVAIAGGTELLLGTDIRVAGESARFGISEARWSLYPMGASAVRAPRQIPYTIAAELLLTGKHIKAPEAKEIGLIGSVVPDGQALVRAKEIATVIGDNGPLAVEAILRTLHTTGGPRLGVPVRAGRVPDRGLEGGPAGLCREAQAELRAEVTRAVVLADTHMRAGHSRALPADVWSAVGAADLVIHAGDVVDHSLLDQLRAARPTYAVLGNNDASLRDVLPARLELDVDGVAIGVVHETGVQNGRAGRVRRWFPECQVVVFGHSHAPYAEWHDGQLLFNPGSPTERRRQPRHSFGIVELAAGRVVRHEIVHL
jgi:putative phosphoesterase